jgi:AAA15 family ATPase/GTPase
MLYVNEKNSNANILQNQMSQGMVRALSLVIQTTYNAFKDLPTTILIDDIGEGLDFDRSSSVIKLILRIADKGKCQLIMSTNDRYVMNNISLKHWQVIQRTGGECKAFNCHNSGEIFEKFAYTGLNNFDFLAMDFINSGVNE